MNPIITAFERSPDRGQGLARDMGVRWALEEVNQRYEVCLVSFQAMKEAAHIAKHPFGQIPTYQEGDLSLFESGAIIHYIAETHRGLFPKDSRARARATMWMFSALSTIEPAIVEFTSTMFFEKDRSWYGERLTTLKQRVVTRLRELSNYLNNKEWLENEFTAGDLMMVTVMRRLKSSGLLEEYQNIKAYIERAEARPAFQRAFKAQLAVFQASESVK